MSAGSRRSAARRAAPGSRTRRALHGLLHVAEVPACNGRSPVRREVDEPLADEAGQRFPERRPGDAELLGERLLPQPGARRELAGDDPLEQLFVHLVDDAPDLELPCVLHGARRPLLGLVLGHRQRDVQRLGASPRGGAPTSSSSRSSSTIVVAQPADAVDLDLDDVAGLDRPRVRRRAGEQHVAGLERDQPRDVGDLVGEREQQVGARVALLRPARR